MPARNPSSVEPLRDHLCITLNAVLGDPLTQTAFNKLCSKGADRKKLETLVLNAVRLRGFRDHDPLLIHGIARTSFERLPADIRAIAQKIELVRENPILYKTTAHDKYVMSLVQDLQKYANGLEATIRRFRSFMLKHPRHYDMQSVSRRKLLRYVHKTTGQPRYALVAEVLSGAPPVGSEEPTVSVSSLRKLYTSLRPVPDKHP